MAIRTPTIKFVLTTVALTPGLACDAELFGETRPGDRPDQHALVLRGGNCNPNLGSCDYRNSFYLGLEEYGLDNLPLTPGEDPDAVVSKIVAYECTGPRGAPMFGTFHAFLPSLSVDPDGNFGPLGVQMVDNREIACTVEGTQWEGTQWYIQANAEDASGQTHAISAELRIAQIFANAGQSTRYYWESNHEYLYGDPTFSWEHTCDEDPDLLLDFHAVVYPYLRIEPASGAFGEDPDTFYLGCTSGLVAKSGHTWGYDAEPFSVHQVITYAGMARYCGPTHPSYTETGTPLAVWNRTGSGPDQNPIDLVADPDWAPEAAWDANMMALCIGQTRIAGFQPPPDEDFDCGGGFTIPRCDQELLNDPSVMFITFSER